MSVTSKSFETPYHLKILEEFLNEKKSNQIKYAASLADAETQSKNTPWKLTDVTASILTSIFKGIVTWINCSGELYFHDAKWAKQLDDMRQGMNEMYEDSEPTKFDMVCKPGDYCIARYIHMISKIVMHVH